MKQNYYKNLYLLYNTYGSNYNLIFKNIIIDILIKETTNYNFFMDRGKIKNDFKNELNKKFVFQIYNFYN